MKILIIEDNEDDRMLYRRSLKQNTEITYDIIEAEEGDTGLAKLEEEAPDCILLDYSLPGRNGIEVLKRIRAANAFVPVVMLTGQGNETIAVSAIQEGAQNYITKSNITPEAIQRIVKVAVEHCALEKRIYEQRTALEIFTRAMAHDLKEPVRTIRSFLELMAAREGFSEKGQVYFNFIQKAAERMNRLIDSIYFYMRLDGSPQQITKELCDMNEVLEEAKENLIQLIRERDAIITSNSLPTVHANRMQMLQLLQNLFTNSIRHSTEQPKIHVEASEEEGQWKFTVMDNGPGIKEQYQGQIFQPFKRLNQGEGLGLGLAICKKIVESFGGKIWYEPALTQGAVFVFTLPQIDSKSAVGNDVKANAATGKTHLNGHDRQVANLLLVEDNEADIELTKTMLIEEAQLKCNFLVARNGFEALEVLHAEKGKNKAIDLILLDINMPGMDGFQLLERMHNEKDLQDIPVVMCTTSTYDKDMDRAKALGASGYMNKPAELDKLKPFIDRASSIELEKENDGYVLLRA